MTEQEMIIKVLEAEKKPLMAKEISKLIFKKFNGYKLYRTKVRDHLWDKDGLKSLVSYNRDNYTYELQKNINFFKEIMFNDDSIFNYEVEKVENHKIDGNFIDYKVEGENVIIQHTLNEKSIDKILIGIIKTELELDSNNKSIFRRIKMNIIKAYNG